MILRPARVLRVTAPLLTLFALGIGWLAGDASAQSQPQAPRTRSSSAEPGGWIDVRSLDRSGDVLLAPQCEVAIISHFGVAIQPEAETPRPGDFTRYGPLPPAGYRVQREVRSHDREGYLMIFEDVTVVPGEAVRLTLDERAATGHRRRTSVQGAVSFDGTRVPGARVTVSDEMGIVARGTADEKGLYDLTLGASGPLLLEAADPRTNAAVAVWIELEPEERKWTVLKLRTRAPAQAVASRDGFARAAVNAGDLDGDGADDLLITESIDEPLPWIRASTLAVSGATGLLLFEVPQSRFQRHCFGVGGVGDVDGDGTSDFVTCFHGRTGPETETSEGLQLRSGRTGTTLLQLVFPPLDGAQEMRAVARAVPDRNGDGIRDIAVQRRQRLQRNTEIVSIEVLDGADFESIQRIEVNLLEFGWGEWCLPGDLDLDGEEDLLVYGLRPPEPGPRLFAVSGRTRRPIEAWEERIRTDPPSNFTAAGDLDGDGFGDLFVLSERVTDLRQVDAKVRALSGRTGAVLAEHRRTLPYVDGIDLATLPDLDGDGVADLLITGHTTFFLPEDPDGVTVHSGANLSLLFPLKSPFQHPLLMDHFGVDGFALNDVNHDGVPDIAVRAMNAYGPSKGYVQLFSGKDGAPLSIITRESARAR